MAVTTVTAAYDQYLANSLYDLHGSSSEAALYIEACRALLLLQPKVSQQGRSGTRFEYDPASITKQLAKAETWYQANAQTVGAVTSLAFNNFRS